MKSCHEQQMDSGLCMCPFDKREDAVQNAPPANVTGSSLDEVRPSVLGQQAMHALQYSQVGFHAVRRPKMSQQHSRARWTRPTLDLRGGLLVPPLNDNSQIKEGGEGLEISQ